ARPGRRGLKVEASGDLETGAHHTVEDVGIVLGQALDQALGDRAGITRYGHAVVAVDHGGAGGARERARAPARGQCGTAASGGPLVASGPGALPRGVTGASAHELTEASFRAVANGARLT